MKAFDFPFTNTDEAEVSDPDPRRQHRATINLCLRRVLLLVRVVR